MHSLSHSPTDRPADRVVSQCVRSPTSKAHFTSHPQISVFSSLRPFLSNFSYFVLCRTYLQHQKKVFGRFLSVATLRMEYSKKNLLLVAIVKGFRVKDLPTQCKKVSKTFGDFLASPYKISRGDFLHPHFSLLSVNKFPG